VRDCTCPVNVLTNKRIEKFASRARAYKCTHHHLQQEHQKLQETAAANEDPNAVVAQTAPTFIPRQQILYSEIERLKKGLKSHRCAPDFDSGFVQHTELRNAKVEEFDVFMKARPMMATITKTLAAFLKPIALDMTILLLSAFK
jgi:hypothetical protein